MAFTPEDGGKKLDHVRFVVHDVYSIHAELQAAVS